MVSLRICRGKLLELLPTLYILFYPISQSLPNAPYMLEEVVKTVAEESSSSVKLQLLSAVMKLFFKRPPECQEMLGTLLEHSIGKLVIHLGILFSFLPIHLKKYAVVHIRTCILHT